MRGLSALAVVLTGVLAIASSALAQAQAQAQAQPQAQTQANDEPPAPALLERPAPMQGYYYSLGLHGGTMRARDEGRGIPPLSGMSLAFHLGQSVTTWMDLGLAVDLGFVLGSERTGTLGSFGIDWTLRPIKTLFFRVSPAIGVNQLSAVKNSDNSANIFGAALGLTVGYAWFPFYRPKESGGFALSPIVRLSSVQAFTDSAAYWVLGGLEITWWTGLPKRQLDLPLKDVYACRGCATGK
jgi:hypothetical protein